MKKRVLTRANLPFFADRIKDRFSKHGSDACWDFLYYAIKLQFDDGYFEDWDKFELMEGEGNSIEYTPIRGGVLSEDFFIQFPLGAKVRFKDGNSISETGELIGVDYCLLGSSKHNFILIPWELRGGTERISYYHGRVEDNLELYKVIP